MKTTSLTVAALLASAADFAFAAPVNDCNPADSCLRTLRATHVPGRGQASKDFCAKYTTNNGADDQTAVPRYIAKNCRDDKDNTVSHLKISSACACLTHPTKRASGTPSTTNPAAPGKPKGQKGQPCAQVSSLWAQQKKKKGGAKITVPASLAYDCLKTVPLGKKEGLDLIDAILPYLEWQSDAEYKKNPPKDFPYPGFDMFANLALVKSNLQAGKYATEYDFQLDLYTKVWAPGQDGHFVLYPDLLSKPFKWTRQPVPLVSISEDGISLPAIKLQSEVLANSKTAQTVTKINNIDAAKFLEDTVNSASYLQDPDAAYNTMFWSKATAAASGSGNFVSGGRISMFYPGPTTSLTFANGTTVKLENLATVLGDMSGVVDGPSMYKKFCTPGAPSGDPAHSAGNNQLEGYPLPKFSTQDGAVTGYYLEGPGVEDVAVLSIQSFDPISHAEFQAVIMDFLSEAPQDGKTKLVLDLQSNVGGTILLGYDLFRQLFPKVVQDGISQFKLSNSLTMMSQVISDVSAHVDMNNQGDSDMIDLALSFFNYRQDLDINNNNFPTYAAKWGPHVFKDPSYKYSAQMRVNVSNPLITTDPDHGIGITVTGYGSLTEQTQPFKPENIVILYDGSCSSTCTSVSEFLRSQGGVKSVAMGGRPKTGPMQGVGGVKGSQALSYLTLYGYVSAVGANTADPKVKAEMARFQELPMRRSSLAFVNSRDTILRGNVKDGLPAQYVYEASDCRLYWTAPMVKDVTEIWKAAANAGFGGAKCAYGGIAKPKSSRRGVAPPAPARRDNAKRERLSDKVDKTPAKRGRFFETMHRQIAVK
ncbi:hypothetical protein E4U53_001148 [Claviceps sorghi]|nr:hypothetical protein E4U53_001148 [Claviceps sorghi]